MTLFQILTLVLLGALLIVQLARWLRHPTKWRQHTLWSLIWAGAALAIARPELIQEFASFVGIGRGADVVLYVMVLAFLCSSLYFYSRQADLRQQLTHVVRHLAIRDAQRGGGAPSRENREHSNPRNE